MSKEQIILLAIACFMAGLLLLSAVQVYWGFFRLWIGEVKLPDATTVAKILLLLMFLYLSAMALRSYWYTPEKITWGKAPHTTIYLVGNEDLKVRPNGCPSLPHLPIHQNQNP